jgi:hypothetical protein
MREALLFVIVVAMVATGLWLFVAGLFFENETNIWYVVSGGWLIGLGGDQLWRDFVAPFLGFEEVNDANEGPTRRHAGHSPAQPR